MNKPRIKIAFLADKIEAEKAGTEKQLAQVVKRLNRDLFDVYLISLVNTKWLQGKSKNYKCYVLNYKGLLKPEIPLTISLLARHQKEEEFDIIHTFFNDSIFVAFLSRMFLDPQPILLSSRRDMGLGQDELWYHKLFRLSLPVVNLAYDGIVVNSRALAKWVHRRELVKNDKIKIIPNGIDIPKKREPIPDLLKQQKADVWVGVVANLKPIKRIDVFLRAFQLVQKKSLPLKIKAIILGDGILREDLTSLARNLDIQSDVYFVGSVDNVITYLQNIDIGVLSSDKEGLSNAIIEYMACGVPVVATNVGGNSELVDNGINGFLVGPDDFTALADALFKMVRSNELRKKMGEVSNQKIREKYLWDKIMPLWEKYYTELARVSYLARLSRFF